MTATVERQTEVGRQPLAFRPGQRYGLMTDARCVTLSVHDDIHPAEGLVWISGSNLRGDYRPALLDVTQARALRDALDLFLAEHENGNGNGNGNDHQTRNRP